MFSHDAGVEPQRGVEINRKGTVDPPDDTPACRPLQQQNHLDRLSGTCSDTFLLQDIPAQQMSDTTTDAFQMTQHQPDMASMYGDRSLTGPTFYGSPFRHDRDLSGFLVWHDTSDFNC